MEQLIAAAADTTPIDVNMDNFMAEVIDGSAKIPIVVQFWAPWCGPCKQLGPLLEKVVAAAKGKVKMVRINIDENQQIAQQMRVQSVPTVYGFFNRQLSIEKTINRWHRLHPHLLSDLLVLINIDSHHLDLALGGGNDLFQKWTKLFTRPTPWRPKLHNNWYLC